jgi:anti-anti-sigma factor
MTHDTSHFRLVKRCFADAVILRASGRLVLGHGARWSAWAPFVDGSARRVCVDLGGVTAIDAAGLGVLVRAAAESRRSRGEFSIGATSATVSDMLRVTGLMNALAVGKCAPHRESSELVGV